MSVNDENFTREVRKAKTYFDKITPDQEINSRMMKTLGYTVSILSSVGPENVQKYLYSRGIGETSRTRISADLDELPEDMGDCKIMLQKFATEKEKRKFADLIEDSPSERISLGSASDVCYVLLTYLSQLKKDEQKTE